MAMRYLGPQFDIHTGGIDNVFPHHEDEIAQSAPIVGDVPARPLGPRRVPADGRPEDGQVGRQLPARHRARRPRYRPARVPLPVPDLALLAQAGVLGSLDRGGRGGAHVACEPDSARLGPPPADGPWAPPPVLRAGRAGDRPNGIASGAAGHGTTGSDPWLVPDRASEPAAPLSVDGRALHDRFVAAIDDDLDLPVALALLREILRAPLVRGRAPVADPRRGPRPGPRPRPRLGRDRRDTLAGSGSPARGRSPSGRSRGSARREGIPARRRAARRTLRPRLGCHR